MTYDLHSSLKPFNSMVDDADSTDGKPASSSSATNLPVSDDEIMRKLLKPTLTEEHVRQVLVDSYCLRDPVAHGTDVHSEDIQVLHQLDSYDDCNWKVAIAGEFFLLKVHNGVESRDFLKIYDAAGKDYYKVGYAGSAIHFQNAIIETLHQNDIPTSILVPTARRSNDATTLSSPVSIHTLPVISDAHSPRQLVARLFKWIDGRCMSDVTLLPLETLADAGRMLGRVDAALDQLCPDTPQALYRKADFGRRHSMPLVSTLLVPPSTKQLHLTDVSLMKAARRYHQWDGKNTVDLRKFTNCISDTNRRAMVESVISSFEETFVNNREETTFLRTGLIMGDCNDANLLLDQDLQVCGVIDFGDSVESWRVLDVSVAMTYGMLTTYGKTNRSISAAAAILRGFNSVYPLTDGERKHLVLLIACRLACSATLGAYSLKQNPANEYLLLHSEPAWKALELIWGYNAIQRANLKTAIDGVFQQACLYTDSHEKVVACFDLVMPDPAVSDLLFSVRVRSVFDKVHPHPRKKRRILMANGDDKPVITFVTGNAKKLEEVKRLLGLDAEQSELPFHLVNDKVDLPELQGDPLSVAREKCRLAADKVDGAVIVEDTSLCFNALNGMPGVFIKWFLDSCGHEGLNRMLAGYDDKTAYAQTIAAFSPGPGHDPVLFDGRTTGRIVMPRGKLEFGWDPIFEPDEGGGKTYAQMTDFAKDAISHRSRAFAQAREYLRKFQAVILTEMGE